MDRRAFLAATAGATFSVGLAGCSTVLEPSMPEELAAVEPERQLPTPNLGDGDVTVDVYEDLGCPRCHEFQTDVVPELEAELIDPGEITYRHYDFVVGAADESVAMANAARAVQDDTGDEAGPNGAFFEYKASVMTADDWSDDALADLADAIDADPGTVSNALADDAYYPTLAADWERGDDAAVEGTPTVVVDGDPLDDPFDVGEIVDAVEEAG